LGISWLATNDPLTYIEEKTLSAAEIPSIV